MPAAVKIKPGKYGSAIGLLFERGNGRGTRLGPVGVGDPPRRLLQDEDDRPDLVAATAGQFVRRSSPSVSIAVSTRAALIGVSLEAGTDIVGDGVPTE